MTSKSTKTPLWKKYETEKTIILSIIFSLHVHVPERHKLHRGFFPACQNTLRLPNLSLSSTSLVICFTNLPMMHCHNFHGVACLEFAMIINHAVCVLKVEQNNTGISLDHLFHALKTIFLPNSSWELDCAVVCFPLIMHVLFKTCAKNCLSIYSHNFFYFKLLSQKT